MSTPVNTILSPDPVPVKKRKRVFMWIFLAVQVLFVVWLIAGANTSVDPATATALSAEAAQSAATVGKGIGMMLIFGMWIGVDFILGVTYLIVRLARKSS